MDKLVEVRSSFEGTDIIPLFNIVNPATMKPSANITNLLLQDAISEIIKNVVPSVHLMDIQKVVEHYINQYLLDMIDRGIMIKIGDVWTVGKEWLLIQLITPKEKDYETYSR